jgi:hypothetical protein
VVLSILYFAHHIEEEYAHIIVKIFVIQEQLGKIGQILTVNRRLVTIYLEDSHIVLLVSVDLIARRVVEGTLLGMAFEFDVEGEHAQAEIAEVEAVEVLEVDGVGTEIPGICGIFAQLQSENSLELRNFLMILQLRRVHTEVRILVGMRIGCLGAAVFNFDVGGLDA